MASLSFETDYQITNLGILVDGSYYCTICGRHLENLESVRKGMGPDCASGKSKAAQRAALPISYLVKRIRKNNRRKANREKKSMRKLSLGNVEGRL